jgi:uncharacterized membrane protein YqjE
VSTARPTTGPRAGEPRTAADPRVREARAADTYTTARTGDTRTVPELLADLARSVPDLVRQEVQLLRSEMSDKVTQIEVGLGSIVAGALLLFAALLVLLQAIVIALTEFVGPGWAALIVGVAVAVIGAVLLKKGSDNMKVSSLMPERTTHQLKQDRDLAKEQAR